MKLIKRIAAVAAAMVMATSMMMTSASALSGSKTTSGIARINGYTSLSSDGKIGYAYGMGYNLTGVNRLVYVQATIYGYDGSTVESHTRTTTNTTVVSSGTISRSTTNTRYSVESIAVYNGTVEQSGQYGGASVQVYF